MPPNSSIGVLSCSIEISSFDKPTMSTRLNWKKRFPLECDSPWGRLPKGVKKNTIFLSIVSSQDLVLIRSG